VSTSTGATSASMRDCWVGPKAARWKFWRWRPISQGVARSNARGASIALVEQRLEREDAEDFLAQVGAEGAPGHDPQ
jgi:hypothetical protein